jgi:dihydroflavonol-4-reductase
MIAFVTGASGFIGSRLVRDLLQDGWEVRCLAHRAPIPNGERCVSVKGDITAPGNYAYALEGVDVVFHLAAALGASLLDRAGFARVNVDGTSALLETARGAGVKRMVHFSSAGVLGSVRSNTPAPEDARPNPKSDYDHTKLEGERLALQAGGQDMEIVIVRPGWVYGPGDRRTFKLIRAIASRRFLLVTRGKVLQTPVYIDDLIHGVRLCQQRGRSGEIYHLAGGEALPVREIVDQIASAAGTSIPRWTLPRGPVQAAAWGLETLFRTFGREAPLTRGRLAFFLHPKPLAVEKAERELGYAPRLSFRDGMALTLAWYRQNGWLKR